MQENDDEEHFEFEPNISELLKQEKDCSDSEKGRRESDNDDDGDDDEEEEVTTEPDFNDYLDQSEDEEGGEEGDEDTASTIKSTGGEEQNVNKIDERDVVKFEEDEVKMEPESESDDDEEEFEAKKSYSHSSTSQLEERLSDEDSGCERVKGEVGNKPKYIYKGENPPCEICGKMFSRPSDLIKHMVTHTGAREFKCDVCQDCFPLLNSLTR